MDGIWEVAGTCGACGHGDWRPAFAIHGRRYGQCLRCAVVRLVDRIAPAHLGLIYDGYYAAEPPDGEQLEHDLANPTFAVRQRRLERAMGRLPRRLFEVGCGDGNFLVTLQRAGWDVSGSEYGETARIVRQRHGLAVTNVDIVRATPPGAPFAAVGAYHVLEHIYQPADWVAAVHRMVQPGGILHLQVPNYAALARVLAGEGWASWCFPQHVFLFTPATLEALLARSGFRVEGTSTWDPWHGPGTAESSFVNQVGRLWGAGSPWPREIHANARPAPGPPPASQTVRRVMRSVVGAGSDAWARLEALLGRGAVVDVVARRI
jgi:SAM-dependent methyltransferase